MNKISRREAMKIGFKLGLLGYTSLFIPQVLLAKDTDSKNKASDAEKVVRALHDQYKGNAYLVAINKDKEGKVTGIATYHPNKPKAINLDTTVMEFKGQKFDNGSYLLLPLNTNVSLVQDGTSGIGYFEVYGKARAGKTDMTPASPGLETKMRVLASTIYEGNISAIKTTVKDGTDTLYDIIIPQILGATLGNTDSIILIGESKQLPTTKYGTGLRNLDVYPENITAVGKLWSRYQ